MPVTTIGGTFLVSHDPARLADWFASRLGLAVERNPAGGHVVLPSADGVCILGIQAARPDAPRPPPGPVEKEPYGRQTMMLNLRVTDLDGLLDGLRAAGETPAGPGDYGSFGRFAWLRTPDGHDVELWEPAPE